MPAAALEQRHRQVELGGLRHNLLRPRQQPRQLLQGACATVLGLERQHHLEQRMPRQRALRVQHLHQPLERQVLVRIGRKVARPHPADQLMEGRAARRVGAQHQRVDEEPDQLVQRRIAASRDRAAQRNVGAPPKPRQQGRQSGLQHHEQAGALLSRQRHQPAVQFGIDRDRNMAAAVARHRSTRPVGRQLDLLRKVLQRRLPVVELPPDRTVGFALLAQHGALPQRVVGILHRQSRHSGRPALETRPVERREVAQQRTQRPAVAGDVMQHHKQHVFRCSRGRRSLVGRSLVRKSLPGGSQFGGGLGRRSLRLDREQMRPQRQLARQIEAAARRGAQRRRKLVLGNACGLKRKPHR